MSCRIAICLYQDFITDINDAGLVVGQDLCRSILIERYQGSGIFFYRASDPSTPGWVEVVKSFTSLDGVNLDTASSGGILLLQIQGRVLACCFGSSVSNVNKEMIVDDFGLGVAFLRILPRNTKSVESFTFSNNPVTNNRTAAIPTMQENFNVDVYLENITELSGFVRKESRSILVKGKEFFSTPTPLNFDSIVELCTQLLQDYLSIYDNEEYKRLTSTRRIRSKALIETLDNELIRKLRERSEDVYVVDFELLENIGSYKLSPKGPHITQLTIDDIFSVLPRRSLTVAYLKAKEVYSFDIDDQPHAPWKLYKCLFCEARIGEQPFMLFKGHWYSIENRYLEDLREFIKEHEIDNSDEILGLGWDGAMPEGKFNKAAAVASGGQCWDKLGYVHPNFNYPIEFCDVLTEDFIIHIKKLKSSAMNSHLLMQTAVSAQLLSTDPQIKIWIKDLSKKKFKKNILLSRNNEFKNQQISYLICLMSDSDRPLAESLPFFSLVSFQFVIKKIKSLFPVLIGKV